MANRPCKPDADLKHLWQMLLPDMPMPNCETRAGDGASKVAAPDSGPRDGAAPTEKQYAGERLALRQPKNGTYS